MADLKITQLTADSAPQGVDLLTIVKSPFGSGTNRKMTVADFMQTQDINWKTTGLLTIGGDATVGEYGSYKTLWNFQETITDFTNVNQYSLLAEITFDPSTNITDLVYAGYEFLVTIPNTNDKDITCFNNSALEGSWSNNGSGDIAIGFGILGNASHNGTGNITSELVAGYFFSGNQNSGNISGTAQKDGNFAVACGTANNGTGYIERNFHYYAEKPYGTGEFKNNWGIYLEDQDIGTTASWAIQTAGGKVEFGAPTGKNSLLYLSSDDVAHGMTDLAPTNVYAINTSISSTNGGYRIFGLSDTDSVALEAWGGHWDF